MELGGVGVIPRGHHLRMLVAHTRGMLTEGGSPTVCTAELLSGQTYLERAAPQIRACTVMLVLSAASPQRACRLHGAPTG